MKMHEHIITVGLDHIPLAFNIIKKIVGDDYQNFEYVQRKTGAVLEVVGRGSEQIDAETGKPSEKPLQIIIRHIDEGELEVTRDLLESLIDNVREEFKDFKTPGADDGKVFCQYCNMHTYKEMYNMHCQGALHIQRLREWNKKYAVAEEPAYPSPNVVSPPVTVAAIQVEEQVMKTSTSSIQNLDSSNLVDILKKLIPTPEERVPKSEPVSYPERSLYDDPGRQARRYEPPDQMASTFMSSSNELMQSSAPKSKPPLPPWYSPPAAERDPVQVPHNREFEPRSSSEFSTRKRSHSPLDSRMLSSEMESSKKYSRSSADYDSIWDSRLEDRRLHTQSGISTEERRSDEPYWESRDSRRSFYGIPDSDPYSRREQSPQNGHSSTRLPETLKMAPWERHRSRSTVPVRSRRSPSPVHRYSRSPPRHQSPMRRSRSPSPLNVRESSVWPPSGALLDKLDHVYRAQISSDNLHHLHQDATGKVPLSETAIDSKMKQTSHFCKLCWTKVERMTEHSATTEHAMMYLRLQINLGLKKFSETFHDVPFLGMDTRGGTRLAVLAIEALTREVLPEHRIEGDRYSEAVILTGNLANYRCRVCRTSSGHINKFVEHVSSEEHFRNCLQVLANGEEQHMTDVVWPSPDVIRRYLLEDHTKPDYTSKSQVQQPRSILKYSSSPQASETPEAARYPTIAPASSSPFGLPPVSNMISPASLGSAVHAALHNRMPFQGEIAPHPHLSGRIPGAPLSSLYVQSSVTTQALKDLDNDIKQGRPGPDPQKMKEILIRSGYSYSIGQKQRMYGGTSPPGWVGLAPEGEGYEVFYKSVPADVFEDELIPLFESHGRLWSFRLMIDADTRLNKGFGFVKYLDRNDAQRAASELNGYEIRIGKYIKCSIKIEFLPDSATPSQSQTNALAGMASSLLGAAPGSRQPPSNYSPYVAHATAIPSLMPAVKSKPLHSFGELDPTDEKLKEIDWLKIQDFIDKSPYPHIVTPINRVYGPPRNWEGERPGEGHEIYVGNLPELIFENELVPLLEKFGQLYNLTLVMTDRTKVQPYNRGFAFAIYFREQDALTASKELDGYEIRISKHLKCKMNLGKGSTYTPSIQPNVRQEASTPKIDKSKKETEIKEPEDNHDENRPGPDPESMKEILAKSGYSHNVTAQLRMYGGPPPGWGDRPQPGQDCEVFCKSLPTNIFEDELIPLFSKYGKIWSLRLGMDPKTGDTRGFCFCRYTERRFAETAVKKLDGYEMRPDRCIKCQINVTLGHSSGETKQSDSRSLERGSSHGPDKAKLEELLNKTGYAHKVVGLQRIYGGPPPNWDGKKKPGRGHEVFCKGIPEDIYEDELVPMFSRYGSIWSLRLMISRVQEKTRGYCFVIYMDKQDAQKAVNKLNGSEIRLGRVLKCNINLEPSRLFIANIPNYLSKEDIRKELSRLTDGIEQVEVTGAPDKPKSRNRGFAFIEYDSKKTAMEAYRTLTSRELVLWGKIIAVDWAQDAFEENSETMSKVKVLYVTNLKTDVTRKELAEKFGPYGDMEKINLAQNSAFLHFIHREDALNAMNKLDGEKLGPYEMNITLAKPKKEMPRPPPAASGGYRPQDSHSYF